MDVHPAYNLDWNLVRTFLAVANGGSLASGAATLGMTHPTAARHVQQLEGHLGMALFSRTAKGLKLNEAGLKLERAAREMQASAMVFQNESDMLRADPVAKVRISVADMFSDLMPEVLMHPAAAAVRGVVELDVSSEQANLLEREADIAVRLNRPQQSDLLCRRVGVMALSVYATADYVDELGLLTHENLEGHRFVDGLTRDYMRRGAAQYGLPIAPEQVAFRSDCLDARRSAVRAGWGLSAFPTWLADREPTWVDALEEPLDITLEAWLVARPEVRDNQLWRELFRGLADALEHRLAELQGPAMRLASLSPAVARPEPA